MMPGTWSHSDDLIAVIIKENFVFDRNGYPFHGRVKAFADAAREEGLRF